MTILHYDDWDLYPGAIIETNTINKSFVRLATLYKEMGVKNHGMILALHDKELEGVNPFDPNLSQELALRCAIEAKDNFWWFLRTIARDPQGSPEHPLLFQANRGIISSTWLYLNHILVVLIMIRQTGKSFGIDWLIIWLLNIRCTSYEISYISKDEKLRGRELERIKAMELTLPPYMKQRGKFDPGNTEVLKISSLNNFFKAYVPNKSEKLADLLGRGMTSQTVIGDELAYEHNNHITVPVMLSSTLAAREVAAMKGEPYGVIFMTTSGKRDTKEGKYAYKMMSEAAVWSEKMFDAGSTKALTELVEKCSPEGKAHVNCTFNHRQLGKTDEWLRQRLRDAVQEDPVQIRADFLNEWPSGTAHSPFTQEIAKKMRESELLDNFVEIAPPEAYAIRWYYKEDEIKRKMLDPHILGCDPSEAIGRDAISLVLINVKTGELAMAADISEGNLIHFAKFLASFLIRFITVTLIIERRSMGTAIVDYLNILLPQAGINPFTRIYNQAVQYADDYPDRFKMIQANGASLDNAIRQFKALFGWATSGSGATSRTELYSRTLTGAAKMLGGLMRDRTLILQTLALEIRNGRVDHPDGQHDDLCIAWLLTYWLMSMGRNLRFYGIEPGEILCQNPEYLKSVEETSEYDQAKAQSARQEVARLTKEIKEESDDFAARRLLYDLDRAIMNLSEQDRQTVAADDLVTKIKEERSRRAQSITPGSYGSYSRYPTFNSGNYGSSETYVN